MFKPELNSLPVRLGNVVASTTAVSRTKEYRDLQGLGDPGTADADAELRGTVPARDRLGLGARRRPCGVPSVDTSDSVDDGSLDY